jgi:hypothetical protein
VWCSASIVYQFPTAAQKLANKNARIPRSGRGHLGPSIVLSPLGCGKAIMTCWVNRRLPVDLGQTDINAAKGAFGATRTRRTLRAVISPQVAHRSCVGRAY